MGFIEGFIKYSHCRFQRLMRLPVTQDCPTFYFWVIIELCFSLAIFQFLHEKLHLSENFLRRIYLRAFFVVLENFLIENYAALWASLWPKIIWKTLPAKRIFYRKPFEVSYFRAINLKLWPERHFSGNLYALVYLPDDAWEFHLFFYNILDI